MNYLARPTLAAAAALTLIAARAEDPPLRGYTAESSRIQRECEAKFRAIPDPGRIRELLRTLSSHPNHLGSPHQKQNAETVRDLFRSWGWQAEVEEFKVLFPTPKERLVEMVAPTRVSAKRPNSESKIHTTRSFRANKPGTMLTVVGLTEKWVPGI